jgi:hypothetical protein
MSEMPERHFRAQFLTLPPITASQEQLGKPLETPQRSAIFAVLYYSDVQRIPCSLTDIEKVHWPVF